MTELQSITHTYIKRDNPNSSQIKAAQGFCNTGQFKLTCFHTATHNLITMTKQNIYSWH